MKAILAATLALATIGLVPSTASAATRAGYVNASVNLRTGPAADYPRIVTLRGGQRVQIFGCINDWSWCDVSAAGYRGWVSAGYLDYDNNGRRVGISRQGAGIGLPVLSFILGNYWDEHYRGKPWYGQRSQLQQRHPQHSGPSHGNNGPSRQPQAGQPAGNKPGGKDDHGQGHGKTDSRHDKGRQEKGKQPSGRNEPERKP